MYLVLALSSDSMIHYKAIMDTSISCIKCRKQVVVARNITIVRCPFCKYINLNPTSELWSRGQSWIRDLCVTFMHKITGTSYPKTVLTLNCTPSPLVSSSEARPRKRALLCGVSYKWRNMLMGAITDVLNMRDLLISNFGFREDSILVLTDAEPYADLVPTKKNIEIALQWLVKDCSSGDSLVFYFSGHGSQELDNDRDEVDGFNEVICPLDYKVNGTILDNDINSTIVRPLTIGVTLHAIIDTCHSATVLDLTYTYDAKGNNWVDDFPPSGAYKGTSGGLAICISACKDNQEAATTSAFPGKTLLTGALTHTFIEAIKKKPRLSYGDLLTSVQHAIEEAKEVQASKRRIIGRFLKTDLSQEVQLSSSEKFDIYKKEFKL